MMMYHDWLSSKIPKTLNTKEVQLWKWLAGYRLLLVLIDTILLVYIIVDNYRDPAPWSTETMTLHCTVIILGRFDLEIYIGLPRQQVGFGELLFLWVCAWIYHNGGGHPGSQTLDGIWTHMNKHSQRHAGVSKLIPQTHQCDPFSW